MRKNNKLAEKYRRKDYTNEPIRINEEVQVGHKKLSYGIKGNRFSAIVVLAAILVILTSFFVLMKGSPSSYDTLHKDLKAAQKNVNFALYIPASMPKDFAYKQGSTSVSQNVVNYHIFSSDRADKKIFFSIQSKPKNVVFEDFYNRILTNKSDVISKEGKAVIGTNGNQIIGSLVTDKVWVLTNTPSSIEQSVISKTVESLKPL